MANFISGYRCPKCSNIYNSKGIKKIKSILEKNNIEYIQEKEIDGLTNKDGKSNLRFDIYLEELNVYIEYDGEQHFKPFRYKNGNDKFLKQRELDKIKNDFCIENDLNLIRIPYTEYKNINSIMDDIINKLKTGFEVQRLSKTD